LPRLPGRSSSSTTGPDPAAHCRHCRAAQLWKIHALHRLTGLRQKVANFPGVTVEHRMGKVKLEPGREVFVVDLPAFTASLRAPKTSA